MENILAVVLAGGQGQRLSILAQRRAKPAMPFAGKYRIIDFCLSNCFNSGVHNVVVLTQYQPLSLAEHIGRGGPWGFSPPDRGIRLLQPYLAREERRDWYKGNADAVYQNLQYIEGQGVELVLVLSGDHVYKMDYLDMLRFHERKQADATLAVTRFPEEELKEFGTVTVDETSQVTGFQEKVKKPQSDLVSMGIYIFKKDILHEWLEEDARSITSKRDFGRNILPRMVGRGRIFAYLFEGYWRDVGTVKSYWESNMDLVEGCLPMLFSNDWPIRTREEVKPPAMISRTAAVTDSLVSSGCVVEGRVERSVLSLGVCVAEGAVVKDSIIMNDTVVSRNCVIDHSILDKEVVVEAGCHIGFGDDFQVNRREPKTLNTGLTIVGRNAMVPAGVKIGRNCVIYGGVDEDDFPGSEIQSGETIRPKRKLIRRRE